MEISEKYLLTKIRGLEEEWQRGTNDKTFNLGKPWLELQKNLHFAK